MRSTSATSGHRLRKSGKLAKPDLGSLPKGSCDLWDQRTKKIIPDRLSCMSSQSHHCATEPPAPPDPKAYGLDARPSEALELQAHSAYDCSNSIIVASCFHSHSAIRSMRMLHSEAQLSNPNLVQEILIGRRASLPVLLSGSAVRAASWLVGSCARARKLEVP